MAKVDCPWCRAASETADEGGTFECPACRKPFEVQPIRVDRLDDSRASRYPDPAKKRPDSAGSDAAVASLILGITSCFLAISCCFTVFAVPTSAIGIFLAYKGVHSHSRSIAIGGMVCSIMALLLSSGITLEFVMPSFDAPPVVAPAAPPMIVSPVPPVPSVPTAPTIRSVPTSPRKPRIDKELDELQED